MKIFLLILVFALTATAQVKLSVDEPAITATSIDGVVSVSLKVLNSGKPIDANVNFELLDADDAVVGNGVAVKSLPNGVSTVTGTIFNGREKPKVDLTWARVRWTLSAAGVSSVQSGIFALSSKLGEAFILNVVVPGSIAAGSGFIVHVTATNVITNQPVAGVVIDGKYSGRNAAGRTNSDGYVALKIPEAKEDDDDSTRIVVRGEKNGLSSEATSWIDDNEDDTLILTTDKAIYQPGQKLRLRGVLIDGNKKAAKDRDLSFVISDDKGQSVFEGESKTSRFGVASTEWQIPDSAALGEYKIEAIDDDRTIGRYSFKLSRYEMPSFSINATPLKPFFLVAEPTAEIKIDASYVFGKPLAGGRVVITRDTDEDAVSEGTTTTDGAFTARLDLSNDARTLGENLAMNYTDLPFLATVTDPVSGRSERRRFDVRLSRAPIHVYIRLQNSEVVSPNIPYGVGVAAFYADGTACRCEVKLESKFEDTTLVHQLGSTRTNRYGAGTINASFPALLYDESSQKLTLRVTADDGKGKTAGNVVDLSVDSDEELLEMRTDKTIYRPDEPMLVELFSSKSTALAYVEIVDRNSMIFTKQVRISNGRARLTIPYREQFSGKLRVSAALFGSRAEAFAAVPVVFPKRSLLKIDVGSLRRTYEPDESAKATFDVKSADGTPVDAALGVFVIDRGIEERAESENVTGNLDAVRRATNTSLRFGTISMLDIENLDTSVAIDADIQVAAREFMPLSYTRPEHFGSTTTALDFVAVYRKNLEKRAAPMRQFFETLHEKSGDVPRNEDEARAMIAAAGRSPDEFRDPWDTPFGVEITRSLARRTLSFITAGPDKNFGTPDDFVVLQSNLNWFDKNRRLLQAASDSMPPPETPDELKALWKAKGIDVDSILTVDGVPLRLRKVEYSRDIVTTSVSTIGKVGDEYQQLIRSEPVRQIVRQFLFEEPGDAEDRYKYWTFGGVIFVLEETSLKPPVEDVVLTTSELKGEFGMVVGTVADLNGGLIPGAVIELSRNGTGEKLTTRSNENGEFRFPNLRPGRFKFSAWSMGFKTLVLQNVNVVPGNAIKLKVTLEVGTVEEVVDVVSDAVTLETSSSSISRSVVATEMVVTADGKRGTAMFTPRVRQYFPETLVWQPELLTGGDGRAVLPFKLADTLSTWKMYAIASTEDGRFALAEREFTTFQPFIAELEPPRVLTVGDRIKLPVTVRNYTDEKQSVNAELKAGWARALDAGTARVVIAPNESASTTFGFEAATPVVDGPQRFTARNSKTGDAIEKPVTVIPFGREIKVSDSSFDGTTSALKATIPANALPDNRTGVVRIFPSPLAEFGSAMNKLLERPHGCGEQTTSSTYPNLMVLKTAGELNLTRDAGLVRAAQQNLDDGYKRLLNYQTPSGGFSFWGAEDTPQPALTAYVIRFLSDARGFTKVDDEVIEKASRWLRSRQYPDGSWEASKSMTAVVIQSLASATMSDENRAAVVKGLDYLRVDLNETSDSATVARFSIAADLAGDHDSARQAVEILRKTQTTDGMLRFWRSKSTPYGGWGNPAIIEATALAARAFMLRYSFEPDLGNLSNANHAAWFLSRSRDERGIWYSTQTTVVALDALTAVSSLYKKSESNRGEIFVNGVKAGEYKFDAKSIESMEIDVSKFLTSGENRVELKSQGTSVSVPVQFVARYFADWKEFSGDESYFRFAVGFDKRKAAPGETITVEVAAQRMTMNGGMVVAEIGLPPGADVEKTALDAAVRSQMISRYDVLPDRVVVYSWMNSGKLNLKFGFRPRFEMTARSVPSTIYDYYNEEARAIVAPAVFDVGASGR